MVKLDSILKAAPRCLGVIAAVSYVLAVGGLFFSSVIPAKYLLILVPLGAVGVALVTYGLFQKAISTRKKVVLSILAALITLISLSTFSFMWSLVSFIGNIQPQAYTTETYTIVAEKSRKLSLGSIKTAAMIETDPYLTAAKEGLKTKTAAAPQDYANTTAVMSDLETDKVDSAVFNSAYLQLVEDNYAKYDSTIEVLGSYTVRIKSGGAASQNVDASKPFVLYISGIDTYGNVSTVSRSDVNMLAVINPRTHRILLVNTPRDYYVQLHGTTGTKDKLTHAGLYGIDMSRQTLEDLYGISISQYIRINFSSLVSVVDALGGVDVYSDYAFGQFKQGFNHMDGKQALAFSRERHAFESGDRQRGKDQQRVIEAIIAKISEPQTLAHYQAILGSVQSALETDMNPALIKGLANNQLDSMKRWYVESTSVDGTGQTASTYSMGDTPLYVMVPDEQTVLAAKRRIQTVLLES